MPKMYNLEREEWDSKAREIGTQAALYRREWYPRDRLTEQGASTVLVMN